MKYTIDEKKIVYANLDPTEGVVLNLQTKNYYRLNETGQIIWQNVAAQKAAEEIAQKLTEEYEIPSDAALSDVHELISDLQREGLLETPPSSTPPVDVSRARLSKKGKEPM